MEIAAHGEGDRVAADRPAQEIGEICQPRRTVRIAERVDQPARQRGESAREQLVDRKRRDGRARPQPQQAHERAKLRNGVAERVSLRAGNADDELQQRVLDPFESRGVERERRW